MATAILGLGMLPYIKNETQYAVVILATADTLSIGIRIGIK